MNGEEIAGKRRTGKEARSPFPYRTRVELTSAVINELRSEMLELQKTRPGLNYYELAYAVLEDMLKRERIEPGFSIRRNK